MFFFQQPLWFCRIYVLNEGSPNWATDGSNGPSNVGLIDGCDDGLWDGNEDHGITDRSADGSDGVLEGSCDGASWLGLKLGLTDYY